MAKGKRSGFVRGAHQDEEERIKATLDCFEARGITLAPDTENKFIICLERYFWERHFEGDRPSLDQVKKQLRRARKAAVEFREALDGLDQWTFSAVKRLQVVDTSDRDRKGQTIIENLVSRGGLKRGRPGKKPTGVYRHTTEDECSQLSSRHPGLIKKDGRIHLEAAAKSHEMHPREFLALLLETRPLEGGPMLLWGEEDFRIISQLLGRHHADVWATATSIALEQLPARGKTRRPRTERNLILCIADAWFASKGTKPTAAHEAPTGPLPRFAKTSFWLLARVQFKVIPP